jgi:hypothetical protein
MRAHSQRRRALGRSLPDVFVSVLPDGADRDRTGDPLVANQVLSQLSYRPERCTLKVHPKGNNARKGPKSRGFGLDRCRHIESGACGIRQRDPGEVLFGRTTPSPPAPMRGNEVSVPRDPIPECVTPFKRFETMSITPGASSAILRRRPERAHPTSSAFPRLITAFPVLHRRLETMQSAP